MEKETLKFASIEAAKVWQPTMMLRWNESNIYCPMIDEFKKTLQQMWTSNLGDIEWRDITIENEL